MKQVVFERVRVLRLVVAVSIVMLALIQTIGTAAPAAAQGTAIIEIVNIDAETGQPAPFTRFQIISENGTVYGPLETDLHGYVAFSVTVDPWGTRFTIEEETPPACASAPDPQTTEPLLPGDAVTLNFTTHDQPDCGLGTIALYSMACPTGFSAPVDDYGPWRDGCPGTNEGIPFTITSVATGESWNPVSGAYGIPGRAPIVGLPEGNYTFQQDDGTPAAVFCLVYDTSNYATSAQPSEVLPMTLQNGIGTISLDGNRVSCDLFMVPENDGDVQPIVEGEPAASDASLVVHLSACPPGYAGENSIYDDCHGNGIAGQPVRVSSDTGFAGTISTTIPISPGPGIASFAELPAGTFTVTTNSPAGADVFVYCTDASDEQIPASFDDVSQSLTLAIVDGAAITCDWYELPVAVQPAGGNSSIEVHVLRCPDGTSNETNLYDACHNVGLANIMISASGPNGFTATQSTTIPTDPGPGVALFADLAGGTYTIGQQQIDPSWSSIMYCSLANADDVVPFAQTDQQKITFDLPVDTGIVCDFYNLPPADRATTLQVVNYTCPMGTLVDATTPLATLEATCTGTIDDIEVTLAPLGQQGSTLESGRDGPGTVLFEGLPSGNYSLSNSIPGDFNTPWAFCGVEGTNLQPLTWLQGGDPLAIDATAGSYLCEWFNNPYNASGFSDTITVTSYLCPPGTSSSGIDRCGSTPLANTSFELVRTGTSDQYSGLTDQQGLLAFDRLLPGKYRLSAIPPAGTNVAVYVVSCTANGKSFDIRYDDATGMRIELTLPGGVDVDCNWYNLPPGQPTVIPGQTSGSITVHKFLCQGKAIVAYNWDTDCKPQTTPAGFSLQSADGRPIAVGSTDSSGIVQYTRLTNGAYRLDETTGNWCHAEADRVDTAGNVLVANGGNTDVFIYNCSVRQVGRLPSTGAGPERVTPAAGFDHDKRWQLALAAVATLGLALAARYWLQHAALHAGPDTDGVVGSERLVDDI